MKKQSIIILLALITSGSVFAKMCEVKFPNEPPIKIELKKVAEESLFKTGSLGSANWGKEGERGQVTILSDDVALKKGAMVSMIWISFEQIKIKPGEGSVLHWPRKTETFARFTAPYEGIAVVDVPGMKNSEQVTVACNRS